MLINATAYSCNELINVLFVLIIIIMLLISCYTSLLWYVLVYMIC